MTREALRALPAWGRARLPADAERLLVEQCCMNPDQYYDIFGTGHDRVAPYTLLIDGIQFHYLPNTIIEGEYKYWGVVQSAEGGRTLRRVCVERNENWRHAWLGFTHYLAKSVESLRTDRMVDAMNYLGILLHTLEDASTFLHSLEGPDGFDLFALNRLLETPPDRYDLLPTSVLGGGKVECEIGPYAPQLLGASVPEAAFRLYTAYARTVMQNRKKLIPLLTKIYAGDAVGADAARGEILRVAARLCADVVYTVFCLAFDQTDAAQVKGLETAHLSDLKPIREPRGLSSPYRFVTWLPDAALDTEIHPRPLALTLDGRRVAFPKGIGSGSHFDYTMAWEIPAGVYRRFSGAVGLHPDLSLNGHFRAEVRLRGQSVLHAHITDGHPAEPFASSMTEGGLLELRVESATGMGGAQKCVNSIVWGDLRLEKAP